MPLTSKLHVAFHFSHTPFPVFVLHIHSLTDLSFGLSEIYAHLHMTLIDTYNHPGLTVSLSVSLSLLLTQEPPHADVYSDAEHFGLLFYGRKLCVSSAVGGPSSDSNVARVHKLQQQASLLTTGLPSQPRITQMGWEGERVRERERGSGCVFMCCGVQ